MEMIHQAAAIIDSGQIALELEQKFRDRSAKLGVIGLGRVGLLLAMEMAQQGFQVTGIDINPNKVESVNAGISYVPEVHDDSLAPLVARGTIRATQSFAALRLLDTISVCMPTPLGKTKDPDLSYIIASAEAIHNHLTAGKLIIVESTINPGTMREVVLPILEKSGLRVGKDFFLAYSPERVDPANKTHMTREIPKVVGGMTPRCTELAALLYRQFINHIVPVSSSESAEMVKLLENAFWSVNIALANEIARMCRQFAVNVWEIIDAAKTSPFGFMPFYPGPGVGGHGIPKRSRFEPRLIELAAMINSQMSDFMVNLIAEALNKNKKSLNGSRILALGVAYKGNVSDTRESPALEVLKELMERGATVSYSDPHVSTIAIGGEVLLSASLTPQVLQSMDCVVVLTDDSAFDYSIVAATSALIVDCRNALRDFAGANVLCL
jgi:UDP-N-acetyl-D-glucosamine dehydrogenase